MELPAVGEVKIKMTRLRSLPGFFHEILKAQAFDIQRSKFLFQVPYLLFCLHSSSFVYPKLTST